MNDMILQTTLDHQEALRYEAIKECKLRMLRNVRRPDVKHMLLNLSVIFLLIMWSVA